MISFLGEHVAAVSVNVRLYVFDFHNSFVFLCSEEIWRDYKEHDCAPNVLTCSTATRRGNVTTISMCVMHTKK